MELTSGAAIGYTGGLVWTQSSFYMDMESWRPMGHGHGHVQWCMVMDIWIWTWAWAWWLRNVCAHGGLTYTSARFVRALLEISNYVRYSIRDEFYGFGVASIRTRRTARIEEYTFTDLQCRIQYI